MSFLYDKDLRAWNSYDKFTKRVMLGFIALGGVAAAYLLCDWFLAYFEV